LILFIVTGLLPFALYVILQGLMPVNTTVRLVLPFSQMDVVPVRVPVTRVPTTIDAVELLALGQVPLATTAR
jgi:hypothetical protein